MSQDQHENKSRARKAQKTGAYILPIKKKKNKHTRCKNNYYYNYYNARNNARCTQAMKTTHGLDGQHQDVDRTLRGTVRQNDRGQR